MILEQKVLLSDHCNYKIGGTAEYFFEFKNLEELRNAISEYKNIDSSLNSVFILGYGTNVLFSDHEFSGLVLKNSLNFIQRFEDTVKVGSGTPLEELVEFAVRSNLSGMEWAGGLPGSVGGAVRGNAGAFGGETKDSIIDVQSINIHTFEEIERNKDKCNFSYRDSIYKSGEAKGEIILSASFKFRTGNGEEIKKLTQEKIDYRIQRHPLEFPNIGSTFKNIPIENVPDETLRKFESHIKHDPFPVLPVAKLIATAGLAGKTVGGAQISTKHPNFIVNLGEAKAVDVLALIEIVKKEIKEKYEINLEEEIKIV